jgi:hypothetical protein
LAQPILARNPSPGNTIQQHSGPPSAKNCRDPGSKQGAEATCIQNSIQRLLVDGVKCFFKVKLEYHSRRSSGMTALDHISGVEEVVDDVPSLNKSGLFKGDEALDVVL